MDGLGLFFLSRPDLSIQPPIPAFISLPSPALRHAGLTYAPLTGIPREPLSLTTAIRAEP